MALVVAEARESGNFTWDTSGTSLRTNWVVTGTDDPLSVAMAVRVDTPTFLYGLIRTRIGEAQSKGNGLWHVAIEYGSGRFVPSGNNDVPAGESPSDQPPPSTGTTPDQPLPTNVSFTTTGGTTHITQSLKTRDKVLSKLKGGPEGAPDTKNAIGLTRDGIEGCDVISAKMEFSWSQYRSMVTFADMRSLMFVTACVNRDNWKSFKPGELLYLGCNGRSTDRGTWELTHTFAYNPNFESGDEELIISQYTDPQDSENLIDNIVLPSKQGWDYVWCAYENNVADNQIYPVPIAAYVEQVYRGANFGQSLGLGS